MISVNRRATAIVQQMIDEQEALSVIVRRLRNGTTVIDAGIEAVGSLEAGRLCTAACLGGLGQVNFTQQILYDSARGPDPDFCLPAVAVSIDHPHIACMASQYAGWAVKLDRYFAIGSGPARALCGGEAIYPMLNYRDRSDAAVLMLEGRQLPNEDVGAFVADKCGIRTDQLTLLIAPTASIVGSIQIAGRSAETGLHKLMELGFDVRKVKTAYGVCPQAPVAADDLRAIGRTNDAILYGSHVCYAVQAEDGELASLIEKIPSSGSRDYGTPFYELVKRYNGDFYHIDKLLFSPARVEISNMNSGRTYCAGRLNPSLLRASLLER